MERDGEAKEKMDEGMEGWMKGRRGGRRNGGVKEGMDRGGGTVKEGTEGWWYGEERDRGVVVWWRSSSYLCQYMYMYKPDIHINTTQHTCTHHHTYHILTCGCICG